MTSNGLVEYSNPAAVRIFRAAAPHWLIGMRFIDLIDLIDPAEAAVVTERRLLLQPGPGQTEFVALRMRALDGTDGAVIEGAAVSYLERGRLLIQIVFRDVTEARKAHAALVERERRLRDMVGASGESVWQTDAPVERISRRAD